jgi:hypothetical protein
MLTIRRASPLDGFVMYENVMYLKYGSKKEKVLFR